MISLEVAKLQQRIDNDDEDELLELLLQAAIDDCVAYLNRPIYESAQEKAEAEAAGESDGIVINAAIKAAMLLVFGYFYAQREDSGGDLPETARRILHQYRRLPGV